MSVQNNVLKSPALVMVDNKIEKPIFHICITLRLRSDHTLRLFLNCQNHLLPGDAIQTGLVEIFAAG